MAPTKTWMAIKQPHAPEDYLRLALGAADGALRGQYALQGLASAGDDGLDVDTHAMLLRQLYRAQLDASQFEQAAETARQMASLGPLADVAHHDASRALYALKKMPEAIDEQRLAYRKAPAVRKSFHLWCLATLQHFGGDSAGALATLERATRYARRDKALIHAHQAFIRLESGHAVNQLQNIVSDLVRSPNREGYGEFLLGMLLHHMGDKRRAVAHLKAFLNRNASAEPAKVATLQEEFRRARAVLGTSHFD